MYTDVKRSLGYIVKWGRRGNLHVTIWKITWKTVIMSHTVTMPLPAGKGGRLGRDELARREQEIVGESLKEGAQATQRGVGWGV